MTHDCAHQGHVWIEADGQPYLRTRNRSGKVSVGCRHCPATAELEGAASYSGQRRKGQPIDHTIPPAFMRVLDRALAESEMLRDTPRPGAK